MKGRKNANGVIASDTYEMEERLPSGDANLCTSCLTYAGLLGMNPTGFSAFTVKPYLPNALDHLYLRNIRAHGSSFDILLEKCGYRIVRADGTCLGRGKLGEIITVDVSI